MRYRVGKMGLIHPVSGFVVPGGEILECEPSQLKASWTDPEWLKRAGLDWMVRALDEEAQPVEVVRGSADPLPVVSPPAEEQSEAGGNTGEAEAEPAIYSADELEAFELAELKDIARAIGLKFGGRTGAPRLRERIAAFQAGA